jgi:hypothetical protein
MEPGAARLHTSARLTPPHAQTLDYVFPGSYGRARQPYRGGDAGLGSHAVDGLHREGWNGVQKRPRPLWLYVRGRVRSTHISTQRGGSRKRKRFGELLSDVGQETIELRLYHLVALAGPRLQTGAIEHGDLAAAVIDQPGVLQLPGGLGDAFAAHAEHSAGKQETDYGYLLRAHEISALRAGPPPYSLFPEVPTVGDFTAVSPMVLPTPTTRGHGSSPHQPQTAPPDCPGVNSLKWPITCPVCPLSYPIPRSLSR